ncbi:MAG: ArsI/CadI family heavy metal resistance metalloenzyme [Rhodanobacter sp.]
MKRFHVHLNVVELPGSIRFYTTLFGSEPSVVKSDYAKWMLDDPRINFAISSRGRAAGVDHLGLQAESENELSAIGARFQAADATASAEKGTTCCYAQSDKFWAEDPQGVRWESFHTHGDATTYSSTSSEAAGTACCAPAAARPDSTACGPGAAGTCC